MSPRFMPCGHFEYWFVRSRKDIPDSSIPKKTQSFGPGCLACYNRMPKNKVELELMKEVGSEEPLYEP